MRTSRLVLPLVALLLATASACSTTAPPSKRSLRAYADQAQLNDALERWRQAYERLPSQNSYRRGLSLASPAPTPMTAAAPAMQSTLAESAKATAPSGAPAKAGNAADSITNVQTAGVDEGGIVKQAGEHLVILRRGRLFTVKVGGDELRPVSMLDAYAPGADPRGAWYDELLIHGQTVVVVGYSYARGGTEIGLFELGRDGSLAYRATYHLRSNDYYSSRNYASRLVGSQLVFYAPSMLHPHAVQNPTAWWPAMRRWYAAVPDDFQRILPATRIFRSDDEFDPSQPLALHTVTRCELAVAPLRCESSAVLGPAGRVFYVSQGSVYVWTATRQLGLYMPADVGATGASLLPPGPPRPAPVESHAALFRLPLDGSAPSGIKAVGMPVDQMSFLEDGSTLNVLLRDGGTGEGMWGAEWGVRRGAARLALLRLPLSALGDGRAAVAREHYRRVPGGSTGPLQNRHIGDWLVWASGEQAWAMRPSSGEGAEALSPGHQVERIEALGRDGVLVGNAAGDLRFTAMLLGRQASLSGSFTRPGARQAEMRTHGFFYRPLDTDEGLLGLPVLGQVDGARQSNGWHGTREAASVVFLRQRQLRFTGLGELNSSPRDALPADGCRASCVDWYGNARPIFLGQRVFALMGYELVEASLRGDSVAERRRVDFSPAVAVGRDARPSPSQ